MAVKNDGTKASFSIGTDEINDERGKG